MFYDNVLIADEKKFEEIKAKISKDGAEKLQVVSGFDNTLALPFIKGQRVRSLMVILRDGDYLTPDYAMMANALFEKYHPIEADPTISDEEKKKAMHQWWVDHYDLLVKSGLNKKDVEKIIQTEKIIFRPGTEGLLDFLSTHKIPLLIISASGLGKEAISLFFKKRNKLTPNIFIVANELNWRENGELVSVNDPIIHTFNKNYSSAKKFHFYEELEPRRNVILLGDSLDDIKMADGFDYENIIKVGFLHNNIDNNIENLKKAFDVVILNDGPVDFVNVLLKELILAKKYEKTI